MLILRYRVPEITLLRNVFGLKAIIMMKNSSEL